MNLKLWLLSKKVKFTKSEIIAEFLGHSLSLLLADKHGSNLDSLNEKEKSNE